MKQLIKSTNLILCLFLIAILGRIAIPSLLGHPVNFSPLDALALFSGAYFTKRSVALVVAFFSVWLGDVLLSQALFGQWMFFYPGCEWQYGAYVLMVLLGRCLSTQPTNWQLGVGSLTASLLFFIISNFGVWYGGLLYPATKDGLITCYIAALPFFKHTLISDLIFTFIIFRAASLAPRTFLTRPVF
jgi:hypothetical protein